MALPWKCPCIMFIGMILWLSKCTLAVDLRVDNPESIRGAAATIAHDLQSMYNGNRTGGVLGKFPYPPYYWWLSGAAWGGMVDYYLYTGDASYYNVTYDALVSQISDTHNYLPEAEKLDEPQGNDDIALWAFAALTAAEYGLREPPAPFPTWLEICDNIFNDYVSRWIDASDTCGGGLKWQVFPTSAGYDYKNSISNGGFLQLAARLARFTNNQTYHDWAERVWDWSVTIGLIDPPYNVFDGSDDKINCTGIDHTLWSYNVAVYLYGTAVLYNHTNGSDLWANRTTELLDFALKTFASPFPNATDVLYEYCELSWDCNIDQYSFRAYLARWLAKTTIMMPQTAEDVLPVLRASAVAAAGVCTGGENGTTCGARWYLDGWDGTSGLGQSLSALEVVQSLLVAHAGPPNRAPT
ncbi:Mannan endo-1,6-alpha-mannosidase DCW1 [Cladophialophora carrionii]|uniref:Mannan endo-1,6-alpha-mannosidase n=1 Tax=Cladophialophora carrionii TaxID=86049 RepID=A0A1C1C7U9_9EURO|nr:Mannan endo-1,6-alpha-mannosidase DCW1 [Cladophialophora carrionii]